MKKIKEQFDFFKTHPNLTYLDSAASTLKVKRSLDKMNQYYQEYGVNIHRGAYRLTFDATEAYEASRARLAKFINATPDEVIFTKGTTEALNLVANSARKLIKPGEVFLTTEQEHNSSVLPWLSQSEALGFQVKYLDLDEKYRVTVKNFKKALTKDTRVVAITYVSNVLGYLNPIKEITKLAHEVGAIVILDAAQAAPHFKIDVKDLDIDFMAFSGHKLYGPTGIGILYAKKEAMNKLIPYQYGGEMVAKVSKQLITYKDGPFRFEAGTPPIAEAIGFSGAIDFIEEVGLKKIHAHEMELKKVALEGLKKLPSIIIYNELADTGVISFNIKGVHPHDAATLFDTEGVCIRSGHHCAGLLTEAIGAPSGTIRASIAVYNTLEDMKKLVDAAAKAVAFFGDK